MIVALLLVLLAGWLTWVIFRDVSVERMAKPVSSDEPDERDRE